jgi:hypothetical protein
MHRTCDMRHPAVPPPERQALRTNAARPLRGGRRSTQPMTIPARLSRLSLVVALVSVLAPACPLPGQMLPPPRPATSDPYTAGDDGALARAGYVSLGPVPISANHSSDDLRLLLPDEPLRWVETAHFRIGCALGGADVAGAPAFVAQLRGELADLQRLLPGVPQKAKVLDGWLRTHLLALRAERLYAAALSTMGCEQTLFEGARGDAAGSTFVGVGPHLGMREKFTVLVFARTASLARYTAAYHGAATTAAARRHDGAFGAMVFAVAAEGGNDLGRDEEAMAATFAYHVAHNLYVGFRSFGHLLPAWVPEGLALRHARQVSERVAVIDVQSDADRAAYRQWTARLANARKKWPFGPTDALLQHVDGASLTPDERLQAFALVDWLACAHRERFAAFVQRLKDPFHERLRFPTVDELMARQDDALRAAFDGDAALLTACWRATLPSKRRTACACCR